MNRIFFLWTPESFGSARAKRPPLTARQKAKKQAREDCIYVCRPFPNWKAEKKEAANTGDTKNKGEAINKNRKTSVSSNAEPVKPEPAPSPNRPIEPVKIAEDAEPVVVVRENLQVRRANKKASLPSKVTKNVPEPAAEASNGTTEEGDEYKEGKETKQKEPL